MRWSEHQIAMLREMGVRLWMPPAHESGPANMAAPVESPVEPVLHGAATALSELPVSGLDWPELRETVAACTACKLCESRRQTVFGVGSTRAHWMIVGEAPGEQEDRQGEPFVGKSGQLLDNMLRAIELTRAEDAEPARQVYIANTLKCRPPGNRNPLPDELAQCEGFLIRQVQLLRPKMILAMGAFAVQSLLRSTEPVGKLRGRVHRYQGVPLVVTYHPAYLLRNPIDKAKAWDDLCLAVEAVRSSV
jgi:DNA polymerase